MNHCDIHGTLKVDYLFVQGNFRIGSLNLSPKKQDETWSAGHPEAVVRSGGVLISLITNYTIKHDMLTCAGTVKFSCTSYDRLNKFGVDLFVNN